MGRIQSLSVPSSTAEVTRLVQCAERLILQGSIEAAIAALREAAVRFGGISDIQSTIGQLLLSLGRYEEGFAASEFRPRKASLHGPEYHSQRLHGETVALIAEGGAGDIFKCPATRRWLPTAEAAP